MHQAKSTAIIYGMIHFLVDFCCAFFVFSSGALTKDFYIGFLIYNFLAFAMQMPVGLIADRIKKNYLTAAAGCLFVLGALVMSWLYKDNEIVMRAALALAGIGNCLFHVGGGIEVMKRSKDKATPLGIFVSPGAIGIFLGTLLGKQRETLSLVFVLLLLGAVLLLIYNSKKQQIQMEEVLGTEDDMYGKEEVSETKAPVYLPDKVNNLGLAIGAITCFFLVVVFRSYLGMIAAFPWKDTVSSAVIALAAVFGGKLTGGFLADKWGVSKAAVGTLLASSLLFVLSDFIWAGVFALFFFNMSMPITLYLAAKVLHRQNGFAFGILTFAIFVGFLPAYAGFNRCNNLILTGLSLISLIFLGIGTSLCKGMLAEKRAKTVVDMKEDALS